MSRWEEDGWELIGHVGVDSGQLIVMDPCYIDSNWQTNQEFEDVRRYRDKSGREFQWRVHFENFGSNVNGKTPNQWIAEGEWEEIPYEPSPGQGLGYNTVSHNTIKHRSFCFPYQLGHDGLAVAFRSGFGDGCYPVYANMQGGRVMQVVIDMDEEEA